MHFISCCFQVKINNLGKYTSLSLSLYLCHHARDTAELHPHKQQAQTELQVNIQGCLVILSFMVPFQNPSHQYIPKIR